MRISIAKPNAADPHVQIDLPWLAEGGKAYVWCEKVEDSSILTTEERESAKANTETRSLWTIVISKEVPTQEKRETSVCIGPFENTVDGCTAMNMVDLYICSVLTSKGVNVDNNSFFLPLVRVLNPTH